MQNWRIKHYKKLRAIINQLYHTLKCLVVWPIHVPDQRRTKLDNKSKKHVFIQYDEKTKAFNLFDPIEKKVIVSRDVHVNEESTWDWKNQMEVKQGESW